MRVKLTKTSDLYGYYDEDSQGNEINDWLIIKPEDKHELFPALSAGVFLEEGFTLRNFFEFLNKYDLKLLHKGIIPFYTYYEKYCKDHKFTHKDDCQYLEFSITHYIERNKIYFQRKLQEKLGKDLKLKPKWWQCSNFDVSVFKRLLLIGSHEEDGVFNKKGDVDEFSISMTQLQEMIDLEIRFGLVHYKVIKDREKYKTDKYFDYEVFEDDKHVPTLIEFIVGCMDDITALGDTPEECEDRSDTIYTRLRKAQDMDKDTQ